MMYSDYFLNWKNLFQQCLQLDPDDRPTCSQLLKHEMFQKDGFAQKFVNDLRSRVQRDHQDNPLLKKNSDNKDNDDNKNTNKKKKKTLDKKVSLWWMLEIQKIQKV